MKKKIYISGPISGNDINEVRKAFLDTENKLKARGYEVFNPLKNGLPPESTTAEHMKADIEALLQCDEIYMMKKWNHSAGCQTEFLVATAIGLDFVFEASEALPSSFQGEVEIEGNKLVHKVKFM